MIERPEKQHDQGDHDSYQKGQGCRPKPPPAIFLAVTVSMTFRLHGVSRLFSGIRPPTSLFLILSRFTLV